MSVSDGPSVRRVILGNRLRELREARGMSVEEVAQLMGQSRPKSYRHETGATPVSVEEVRKYLAIYDVENTMVASHILQMAVHDDSAPWRHIPKKIVTWSQGEVAELESMASRFLHFEPMIINGLIQCGDYVEAINNAGNGFCNDTSKEFPSIRKSRQEILYRENRPEMVFITTEASIRFSPGGDHLMQKQTKHMVNLIRDHGIDIRIIPFGAGLVPGTSRPAFLAEIGKQDPVVVAYVEIVLYGQLIDDTEAVSLVRNKFDSLLDAALSPQETAHLLENYHG